MDDLEPGRATKAYIDDKDAWRQERIRRANGERQAVNAPVQGWAADYTKLAMLRAVERQKQLGWYAGKTWLLMNQHDALIYEVSEDIAPTEFIREMRPRVEFPIKDFPDIETDWEFGYRYGSAVRVSEETEFERSTDGRWQVKGSAPLAERDEFIEEEVERDFHEIVGPALPEDSRRRSATFVPSWSRWEGLLLPSEFHAFMRLHLQPPRPVSGDAEVARW